MKAITVLLLLLCSTILYAQECDCKKKFDSVHVYLKRNYVGFIDKVTPATQQVYVALLTNLRLQAATTKGATHCMLLINRYLRFFKDPHLVLNTGYVPVTEKITLSQAQLDLLVKQAPAVIPGIYHAGNNFEVAVVKNIQGLRTYAGVVTATTEPEWKPGDVIFELVAYGLDKFDFISYQDRHHIRFDTITIRKDRDGLSQVGWENRSKIYDPKRVEAPAFPETGGESFFFRQVNDSTGYLRISSFDEASYYTVDSILNANDGHLRENVNLVIDVRNSGMGTDRLTERLRPLLYTQPVKIIGTDFYATPENISAWSHILDEQAGKLPDEYLEQIRRTIHQGDGLQGRLVSMGPDENMILPSPLPAPVKVALIINGNCRDAAEQFLLEATQSNKVKLFGKTTAGALDYANVNQVKFTAPDFSIDYPVTRSRRVAMGQGIDNKGIQPAEKLDFHSDTWLEEVLKKL